MTDEFNEFISNWSDRKVLGGKFDDIFQIDGTPLSWFYRPILYSSLLPPPFPSAWKIEGLNKPRFLLKFFVPLVKSYILYSTILKKRISATRMRKRVTKKKSNSYFIEAEPLQNRQKILFLTFTNQIDISEGETIPKLDKVIRQIKEDDKYEPFLVTQDLLSSLNPYILNKCENTILDYFAYSSQDGASLSRRWKEIPKETKQKWMTFKGQNFWGLMSQSLNLLYSKTFIDTVSIYYYSYKKLLASENIKAIVLTSQNNIFEKCIIAAARKHNIPVLIIQHGVGLGMFRTVDLLNQEKFLVWGDQFKKYLLDLGVRESQIAIVGNPAFDNLAANENYKPDKIPHLLLITGPFVEDQLVSKEDYFEVIKRVTEELSTLKIPKILKLHPREKYISKYQNVLQGKNISIIQKTTGQEYKELLQNSSLIITFGSSITFEAIALGKRALIIDIYKNREKLDALVPPLETVPIIHWRDFNYNLVENVLMKEETLPGENPDVEKYLYRMDGKVSGRVVDEIYSRANSP
jgi:hypothetical protein